MPLTYAEWAAALIDLAERTDDPALAIQAALDAQLCLNAVKALGPNARPE